MGRRSDHHQCGARAGRVATLTQEPGLPDARGDFARRVECGGTRNGAKDPQAMKHLLLPLLVLSIACNKEAPSDRLRVSGHVEATETRIAAEAGGRILTLAVKEGDRVGQGQTI